VRKIFLIYFLVIFFFINIFSFESEEKRIFEYFYNQGFIVRTLQIYSAQTSLTSMEKAEILTEILEKMFEKNLEYTIDMKTLRSLREFVKLYSTEILISGRLLPEEAERNLTILMYNRRDIEFGYTPDLTPGIKAQDVLKTRTVVEDPGQTVHGKYIPQDRETLVRQGNIRVSNVVGFNLNKKSYFSISGGLFNADGNFKYTDDEFYKELSVGFHRTSRMAFDIKMADWSSKKRGNFFGVANEEYGVEIKPLMFSVKMFLFKFDRIIPYSGYGITRINVKHTIHNTGEVVSVTDYSPHFFYGGEFFEKKMFSIFGELKYFLSNSHNLNIRGTNYKVETDKFILTFGVKFYFNG